MKMDWRVDDGSTSDALKDRNEKKKNLNLKKNIKP